MFPINIDPEFQALLGEPSEMEYENLKADIKENNIKNPILIWVPPEVGFRCSYCCEKVIPKVVWSRSRPDEFELFCTRCGGLFQEGHELLEKCYLIDGHNRLKIAGELELKKVIVDFIFLPSREEALKWIAKNQLSRRNLTPERRKYCIGLIVKTEGLPHGVRKRVGIPVEGGTELNAGSVDMDNKKTLSEISSETKVPVASLKASKSFVDSVEKIDTAFPGMKTAIFDSEYKNEDLPKVAELIEEGKIDQAESVLESAKKKRTRKTLSEEEEIIRAKERAISSLKKLERIDDIVAVLKNVLSEEKLEELRMTLNHSLIRS